MNYEKSCGAVVFTRKEGIIKYVLVQQLRGFYGFPKGHVEKNETEKETALREIFEEVHLKPDLIDGFTTCVEYILPNKRNVKKKVVFFLAEYNNQEIIAQKEELTKAVLVTYDEAMNLIYHDSTKRVLKKANDFIKIKGY